MWPEATQFYKLRYTPGAWGAAVSISIYGSTWYYCFILRTVVRIVTIKLKLKRIEGTRQRSLYTLQ